MSEHAVHSVLSNKNPEQTVGNSLAELVKVLEDVDESDKLAKLNEITISDNNGGRITL